MTCHVVMQHLKGGSGAILATWLGQCEVKDGGHFSSSVVYWSPFIG